MKHWKNLFCLLLVLALCLALFPAALAEDAGTIAPAEEPEEPGAIAPADGTEEVYSGSCGANLTWSFDDSTGVLTITGTGAMTNWTSFSATPWYSYRTSILSIKLPEGLTSIGDRAFSEVSSPTSITIPSTVTKIGTWAFYYCEGLKSLEIPNGVTEVGDFAFCHCTGLTSVSIPDSVKTLKQWAFGECSSLLSVTVPASVTSIEYGVFATCTSMTAINVAAGNPNYCSMDGVLYSKNQNRLIQCPAGRSGEFTIPNCVGIVGHEAFSKCSKLTAITIPKSVGIIEDGAFGRCTGLTSITIPSNVTELGTSAFAYCTGLTDITIQNGLKTIGGFAFNYCTGLSTFVIPESVKEVGASAFINCSALAEIYFEGQAPTIGENAFRGVTARAYYPGYYDTWTEDVRQNYGGNITWVPSTNPFEDVIDGKYYYVPVLWAYFHDPQITAGTDDTHFAPNTTCTRAQIVTFLWRAAGAPEPTTTDNPFTDVEPDKYYYKAVLWAYENGITSGVTETTFGPKASCTRAQVVSFLWRYANSPQPTATTNPFEDVESRKYYYKAVLWAAEKKITSGIDDTHFGPDKTCTRGQIVTFLYNYMEG